MNADPELTERWQAAVRSFGSETMPSDAGWKTITQQGMTRRMSHSTSPSKTPVRLVLAAAAVIALVGIGIAVFTSSDRSREVDAGHEGPGIVHEERPSVP